MRAQGDLSRISTFLSEAGIAGAAASLGSGLAYTLPLDQAPQALVGEISPRKGVLACESLAQVETSDRQKPRFPMAMTKWNRHSMVIEGGPDPRDATSQVGRFQRSKL